MAIKDMVPFEKVEGNFIVRFKKPVQKYARGYSFQLNVGDATGSIMLKYWGPDNESAVKAIYDSINEDDVVFIRGKTDSYKNVVSINVDAEGEIRKLDEGKFDKSEFIRVTDRDPEKLEAKLNGFLKSVKDEELRNVIEQFVTDEDFMKKFVKYPAAMYRHQGWIGGLMEHSLNMMSICEMLYSIYPELDRDLMITSCFLHDIGKLKELEMKGSIKVTDDGMLVGHITEGVLMVNEKLKNAEISEKKRRKLLHILISHHGELEYGSPKTPIFPEALAVAYADRTDSLLSQMIDLKKNAETDDKYFYSKDTGNIYLE